MDELCMKKENIKEIMAYFTYKLWMPWKFYKEMSQNKAE